MVMSQFHAHEQAEPVDAEAVGVLEQLAETGLGGVAGKAREVAVQVPDLHALYLGASPGQTGRWRGISDLKSPRLDQ